MKITVIGFLNHMGQEFSRATLASVVGNDIHAENHLPRAAFRVHSGILIHFIPEIRLVRNHTIDKAYCYSPVQQ